MYKINELNWTFCQFKQDDCFAAIYSGGDVSPQGDCSYLYYVNVLKSIPGANSETDHQYKEVDQEVFTTLEKAIEYINANFSHWHFINQLSELSDKNSGGCQSCVAH